MDRVFIISHQREPTTVAHSLDMYLYYFHTKNDCKIQVAIIDFVKFTMKIETNLQAENA